MEYVEGLTLNETVFADRAFKEVKLRINKVIKVGLNPIEPVSL